MAVKLGLDAKVYRNTGTYESETWNEVTNVKDLTLGLEKTEADVTTRGSGGWRLTKTVLKEGTVEFEMVWDTEDEDFTAIKDAWFNDTAIEFAIMDGDIAVAGAQGLRAAMEVITFTRNEPLEEALTVSVTMKPTASDNAPAWLTVTS